MYFYILILLYLPDIGLTGDQTHNLNSVDDTESGNEPRVFRMHLTDLEMAK